MSDPRLSLGSEMFPTEGERILDHLDRHRPVIKVGPDAGLAARLAAMSAYSMTARLFPNTVLEGAGDVGTNPWGIARMEDLPARLAEALPMPTRGAETDIVVGVATTAADLYIGGDEWTAVVGRSPVSIGRGAFPIGLQGAATLASSELAKQVFGRLGLSVFPMEHEVVWNLINYRLQPAPVVDMSSSQSIRVAVFGAGSVGSSFVGVQVMVDTVSGQAMVVDGDTFDPTRNPYRYPASTPGTAGPKAQWLAELLQSAGWIADWAKSTVGAWVPAQPEPGFDGIAVSSVDDVDGRWEVADFLANTTLSLGVGGLALHIQRERLGDDFACPFCEFVTLRPAITQSQAHQQLTGIPAARIELLRLTGEGMTEQDLQQAVSAQRIKPESVPGLIGRRIDDLIRQVYADAVIPTAGEAPPTPVSAPHVSWAAGLLAAAEVTKTAYGLPAVDRRVNLDLSGVPLGRQERRGRDNSGRCACASPVRRRWMDRLYPPHHVHV